MQLQLLSYRKEDIMDLLQSLKSMTGVSNQKKKTEILENELLKIDHELFELEKKYGEFKIRKGSSQIEQTKKPINVDSSASSNDQSSMVANMPAVERSSMRNAADAPRTPDKTNNQDDTAIKEESSF